MLKTACSLFSGCGGDSLGMETAGIKVTHYVELQKIFCESHEANLKSLLIGNDITKIDSATIEKHKHKFDVVFAGFPCQSFSNGGKKDPEDPRGQLFKEFVRFVRLTQPKVIIGENVKGLLTRKTSSGEYFIDVILRAFDEIGYTCITGVFKCEKYNVPQKRERLIILGKRKDLKIDLKFPEESITVPSLRPFVKYSLDGAMKVSDTLFNELQIPERKIVKNMNDRTLPDESKAHPFLQRKIHERNIESNGKTWTHAFSFAKRVSPHHAEIVDIDAPCKTIICTYEHQPRLFVALENASGKYLRTLTIDELKQVQGFPKSYILCGSSKQQIVQIGNAVPPPLITQIINKIKK